VRNGDLRDATALAGLGPADLVTGTPPYLPPGTAPESARVQKGPCNFEHRGGVESYCAAAATLLAPHGVFVTCAQAGQRARVHAAARAAALTITHEMAVVPRAGKAALFAVYAMRATTAATRMLPPLVVRDEHGVRTEACRALRAAMGLPP
jgi:tRNA1(Val) A37 N6-methylase TrmN6